MKTGEDSGAAIKRRHVSRLMFLTAVMHADRYRKCLHPLAIKARGEMDRKGKRGKTQEERRDRGGEDKGGRKKKEKNRKRNGREKK